MKSAPGSTFSVAFTLWVFPFASEPVIVIGYWFGARPGGTCAVTVAGPLPPVTGLMASKKTPAGPLAVKVTVPVKLFCGFTLT